MGTITARKIDNFTAEITEVKDPVTTVAKHKLRYLRQQRKAVVDSKAAFVAARNVEIAYLDDLIAKIVALNIQEEAEPIITP